MSHIVSSAARSPSSSPARKRQRLSSPTYDTQIAELSPGDLDAFDAIEAKISLESLPRQTASNNSCKDAGKSRAQAIADVLSGSGKQDNEHHNVEFTGFPIDRHDTSNGNPLQGQPYDPENPFTVGFKGFTSALKRGFDFESSQDHLRSPSPEASQERDYSSWFEPRSALPLPHFQSIEAAAADSIGPSIGFKKASNRGWIAPSVAAFSKAQEKMKEIWQETDPDPAVSTSGSSFTSQPNDTENAFRPVSTLNTLSPHKRPALRAVENSFYPDTPTPSDDVKRRTKVKPFKSPFLKSSAIKSLHAQSGGTAALPFANSPLNPNVRSTAIPGTFVSAGSQHSLDSAPNTAPNTTPQKTIIPGGAGHTAAFTTPVQRAGAGKRVPASFTTPFKVGMKPGEPGRLMLEKARKGKEKLAESEVATPAKPSESRLRKERPGLADTGRWKVFDLTRPPNRQTLASSGLLPQQYSSDELDTFGINVAELSQITPTLALYYSFQLPSLSQTTPATLCGASAALSQLLDRGCSLATKPWVDNHWCLVLWKLAGMVALDPALGAKRWCWDEVMRQLLYRYERELNGGSRPPLRLIATQDAPASCPMVLCVSSITWSDGRVTEDGVVIEPHPELEVTDGWYRLRARVDEPLARAIRKGTIRIGRKIAVAGAWLSSERKEPTEVLEAFNSTKLVLSGNSSHMAAWHAKLGFVTGLCIATLHSLSADGGNVAVMDIVVIKAYPVAFVEFIENEDGQKYKEGPRAASEEAKVNELWMRRREVEESKLRSELEKMLSRYEGYADRLERQAGARFQPGEDDSAPDHIESLYDELEDPADAASIFARLSPDEAGWLARFIRTKAEKDRETSGEAFEQELKSICPPRDVRNFRVIVVEDACTRRRPANRRAQLTVWDVLTLSFAEGSSAGSFQPGQRFLVTNLLPTQRTAWMDREVGSEVYLSTRRDTRWTKIKN